MISALLIQEGKEPKAYDMPYLRRMGRTREQIKAQQWQCKFCGVPMTPKAGPIRDWYFAHKREASECPFQKEGEPESPQHLALKRAAAESLRQYFGDEVASLEYEVRFPHLGRIADALITLKDSSRIAVEAQLSPLTLDTLQERTNAYQRDEVDVVWVFREEATGGLREGGLWDTCRNWLLEEGYIVLTAKIVNVEKNLPLEKMPK